MGAKRQGMDIAFERQSPVSTSNGNLMDNKYPKSGYNGLTKFNISMDW
jgi:hypothetical protein